MRQFRVAMCVLSVCAVIVSVSLEYYTVAVANSLAAALWAFCAVQDD